MKTLKTILLIVSIGFIQTQAMSQQKEQDTTNRYTIVEHSNNDQIKTLFGGNHSNGFYISYDMGMSMVNDNEMFETGGRLAWIIDHSFALGLFGSGFVSTSDFDKLIDGKNTNLTLGGGYGGLLFEPIIAPKQPIHLSFPIMLGVGGAGYDSYNYNNTTYDYWGSSRTDAFTVLRVGAEVELNLVRFIRMAVGVGYRHVYGFNIEGFKHDDLDGLSGNITFKFGKF